MSIALSCVCGAEPARAEAPPPNDPVARRHGAHFGTGVGPTMSWLFDATRDQRGEPRDIYGVFTHLLVNVGISPLLDFRAGLAADGAGSRVSYLSAATATSLRFNLGSVYTMAFGASIGVVSNTKMAALYVGPEWSLVTLRFGRERQFEIGLDQSVHLHLGRTASQIDLSHFQTSIVLTYLFVGGAS